MLYIVKRLRCITLDITGTLIAYKGDLGDSYCLAVQAGFKVAYAELAKKHPCFGFADNIPNYVWWKICVRDSFVKVFVHGIILGYLVVSIFIDNLRTFPYDCRITI